MMSLRGKLIVWFTAFSFALAAVSTILMYFSIGHQFGQEDQNLLAARVHSLRIVLNANPVESGALERELEWKSSSPSPAISYARVLNGTGGVIAESQGMRDVVPVGAFPDISTKPINQRIYFDLYSTTHDPYRGVVAKIEDTARERGPWIVQVALNRAGEASFLEAYRRKAGATLFFGLLVAIAVGWTIVHQGFRPIQRLVAASRKIRSSTLNERIETEGLPTEVRELASTLNDVLDRLEDSFSRLSRFSADIAHELRTPLNNLRGETEVALGKARSPDEYRELLGSNLEEYGRLAKVIESLLFLARAEDPKFHVTREDFELEPELETLFDFYEGLASDAEIKLSYTVFPGLRGYLERTLFLRAVGNIVLNAIRYTRPGGSVTARVWEERDYLRVNVTDTGIGIEKEHLPRLFERFYRADPSRSSASGGIGLGLSIVKTIVELHNGSVEIESEVGKGTTVRLSFFNRPVQQPSVQSTTGQIVAPATATSGIAPFPPSPSG